MKFMQAKDMECLFCHQMIKLKNHEVPVGQVCALKFCRNLILLRWNHMELFSIHVTRLQFVTHYYLRNYSSTIYDLRLFENLEIIIRPYFNEKFDTTLRLTPSNSIFRVLVVFSGLCKMFKCSATICNFLEFRIL